MTPFRTRNDFSKELTIDEKLQIFRERVIGWQLDVADRLINGVKDENGKILVKGDKDAGFAVLNILLSYFEMVGKYRDGYVGEIKKGKLVDDASHKYFTDGINMVFPEFEKDFPWLPAKIYQNARCGLYHHGMTEEGIGLMGGDLPPITPLKDKGLIINPHALVLRLKEHFQIYMKQLESNKDFKLNFEKRFNKDNT